MAFNPSPIASPTPLTPPTNTTAPTTKPFRFKRKRTSDPEPRPHRHRRHHHHHHHHHRSYRHPPTTPPEQSDPFHPSPLDPNTAFRESLFDALADDEGAAFWESVYGQPIHTYPRPDQPQPTNPDNDDVSGNNIHRLTDDEYASYVRSRMWEKSHSYIVEERARREEARRAKKRKDGEWERGVEEALRRGEERRRERGAERRWRGVWEGYLRGWEGGGGVIVRGEGGGNGNGGPAMRERIVWPVESGRWEDVGAGEVERFFERGGGVASGTAGNGGVGGDGKGGALGEVLKKERVKWHPDKMQQRAGEGGIDAETLKLVTAVFQVVDRMWSKLKGTTKQ